MKVQSILDFKGNAIFAVGQDCPISDVIKMMEVEQIGAVLVTNAQDALVGLISERDIIRSLNKVGARLANSKAHELMSRNLVTCTPESTLADTLALMPLHNIRHLPVTRDGRPIGVISIRDMLKFRVAMLEEYSSTLERAKREAMEAKETAEVASRAKTDFLSNMSHELRTPLNAILGFSELLCGRASSEKEEEYAQIIHETGAHLLALVDDILDLARIDASKLELHETTFSFGLLISACVDVMADKAKTARIALTTDLQQGLPNVKADERAIKQILTNLIANAVEFTPAGGSVAVFARMEHDGSLAFGVKDTGIGVAEEDQPYVFDFFRRGRHAAASGPRGPGLGLRIARGLVDAHGGRIELQSREGSGTCITVCLTVDRVCAVEPPQDAGEEETDAGEEEIVPPELRDDAEYCAEDEDPPDTEYSEDPADPDLPMAPRAAPRRDPSERRKLPRKEMLSAGVVSRAGGENASDCIILDMNAKGAQIGVSAPLTVGSEVCLLDASNREAYFAKVAWSKSDRAGLSFFQHHTIGLGLSPKFKFLWKLLLQAKVSEIDRAVAMGRPAGAAFSVLGLTEGDLQQMAQRAGADKDTEHALLRVKHLLNKHPTARPDDDRVRTSSAR